MAASFSFARGFMAKPKPVDPDGAREDFEALLARIRSRLYPESIPVLASYWLKTVYRAGHKRPWWQAMRELLRAAIADRVVPDIALDSLREIQVWIEQSVLHAAKVPAAPSESERPYRPALKPERLQFYLGRLLNQWLPAEVARVLIDPAEAAIPPEDGIPALAVGRALERLLLRERLPWETLEALLDPELLTVESVYPADAEIFGDLALMLLGRTGVQAMPTLPAMLLGVASASSLPPGYREAVRRAFLVHNEGVEELRVPITSLDAKQILTAEPVRIGSLVVTRDGRFWESWNLQSGDRHFVIYRSGGRLRVDNSADRSRLHLPWPATPLHWEGSVHLPDGFDLFGREWCPASLETDGQRSVLNLVSSRALPIAEPLPGSEAEDRRSHPAAVDMAWAEFRNALAAAVDDRSLDPVEQLRRSELIALGRAIFGLAESVQGRRSGRDAVEMHLKAIRYHESEVSLTYGRVPWSVLPPAMQVALRKHCADGALRELCAQVFDEAPQPAGPSHHQPPSSQAA